MLSMLIAYDEDGNVTATLSSVVARDAAGAVIGLVDVGAHEERGGEMTDVWVVKGAKGSKVWPEWIGAQAHAFRVELAGPPGQKRLEALVHRTTGHRRERKAIEEEIGRRIAGAAAGPADIRDVVGGPDRPLVLDEAGRTIGRSIETGTPRHLPLIRERQPAHDKVEQVVGDEPVRIGGRP